MIHKKNATWSSSIFKASTSIGHFSAEFFVYGSPFTIDCSKGTRIASSQFYRIFTIHPTIQQFMEFGSSGTLNHFILAKK